MLELKIKTPDDAFLKAVEFNFDELKNELSTKLEDYRNLTYTDSNIKCAKEDRAKLNNVTNVIDSERKRVKEMCLQAYIPFESKIKELTNMISACSSGIDTQIKSYENKQKEDKKAKIAGFFDSNIGELKDLLKLTTIYNSRWENVTFKMEDIESEIVSRITQINTDLETIGKLKSKFEMQLKDMYLRNFDLGDIIIENDRLIEQEKKLETYNTKLKGTIENAKEIIQEIIVPVEQNEKVEASTEIDQPTPTDTFIINFSVNGTRDEFQKIAEFFKANNINYKRL